MRKCYGAVLPLVALLVEGLILLTASAWERWRCCRDGGLDWQGMRPVSAGTWRPVTAWSSLFYCSTYGLLL